MSKNFFQDVVPPERRSIRNVSIAGARRNRKISPEPEEASIQKQKETDLGETDITGDYRYPAFSESKKKFPKNKVFIIVAGILVVGFIFGMMTAFTSASIDIVPKKEAVSYNLALKAIKNPPPGESALRFEVIELKREDQIEVPASGEEMAEKKASGVVVIYNDFSKDTQRLIARTRFETSEGLIYRIAESIIVPGKTLAGPGQIEATIFADEAGEKYNLGKTDFTVPGFKNDALRYKGFYAKSKTPITGGFVGKVKKVNQDDKKTAIKELEESIKAKLQKEVQTKIPDGLVSLQESTVYEFKDLGQVESSDSSAFLKLAGSAAVVVFDKKSLSSVIAKEFLPDWAGIPVEIRSFDNMTVSFDRDED
jgi:hypothetical protein